MIRNTLYPLAYAQRKRQILRRWRRAGRPAPPPAYFKHDMLKRLAADNPHLSTFVETGTWKGDMLYQLRNQFELLHSVELDKELHAAAQKRLARFTQITLWRGHSPDVLHRIVPNLAGPTLFWLDAHYMGGPYLGHGVCPALAELSAICPYLNPSAGHIILIDDARNFIAAGDYPTLAQVKEHIGQHWPTYSVTVQDDIIICRA